MSRTIVSLRPARFIVTTVFLCLAAARDFPDTMAVLASPSCAIFTIQDLSATRETSDYEHTITDSISASFQVAGFAPVASATWEEAAEKLAVQPAALREESPCSQSRMPQARRLRSPV